MTDSTPARATILFGAFDRHNFGDMLFAHVVARLLPDRALRFAGLAHRDLRAYGGHRVESISSLASEFGTQAVDIVHVGGELLTCDAWEAAVMLSPATQANAVIDQHEAWLLTPRRWAEEHLGSPALAPYLLPRERFAKVRTLAFNAIGGVDFDQREPNMRAEAVRTLGGATDLTVRDIFTQESLRAEGIEARLLPDPAVMVADLFGDAIRARAQEASVAKMRGSCPNGYMAVQFSADFGDDRTLSEIAAQLDAAAALHGIGVVFFRAGLAPWHDNLDVFERTRQRMKTPRVEIFTSPNVWDICALIAGSRVYCGSSLHGRIVASAFALPRVNVRHPARTAPRSKHTAFAATWEDPAVPSEVAIADIAQGIDTALHVDPARFERVARTLADTYRSGFRPLSALLA